MSKKLRVLILKPSKYRPDGAVERFRRGFMPNSTLLYMRSMTPDRFGDAAIETHVVDEYVHTDLAYLDLLRESRQHPTLLALVGVQSHQFHRALDLAAFARRHGAQAVMGGPHPMTCDTSDFHGTGVSFALSEAELVWHSILADAIDGELRPVYGQDERWQAEIEAPALMPPSARDMRRYVVPMLGIYPARGCPFICNFCSVIKIAGRRIRSQSIETTLASLRAAREVGIRLVMFTSDNFNKYPEAEKLLEAMIEERLDIRFFAQCDTQIARQEGLVDLMARAGCFHIFLGVESFDRSVLLAAKKGQNRPETYEAIVKMCERRGISSHFSNIIGFPQSTEADIEHHLETLIALHPTWASFYILCPIPGTEQYGDFLREGLITESNLDRFDAITLNWKHPHFSAAELRDLLFRCYTRFNSLRHAAHGLRSVWRYQEDKLSGLFSTLFFTGFHRFCAARGMHPMAGGFGRVARDNAADYLPLRREFYGIDLAPLPQNLETPSPKEDLVRIAAS
jgi:radical SAM family protein